MDNSILGRFLRWFSSPQYSPFFFFVMVASFEIQRNFGFFTGFVFLILGLIPCALFEIVFGKKKEC